MAIIYSYPQGTPTLTDNVIGSQIDPITEENKTVQFTIGSIATLIGSGGGTGTVTTVSATIAGNAFDVAITDPTTAPALGFTWAGTAAQYITGQGNLSTSLVIGTTSTTAMAGNTTTITSGQASAITANTAKVTFPGFGTTSSTALAGNTTIPTVSNATISVNTAPGLNGAATFNLNQASSETISLALDLSELADMTATMLTTDEFIVLDSSAQHRKAAGEIGLSIFNNDAGFLLSINGLIGASSGINVTSGSTPVVSIDYTGANNLIGQAPNATTVPVADDKFLFMVEDISTPANKNAFEISASEIGLAQTTVTVTAAQLNALQTTDVTLIPAPTNNRYIRVLDASFYFNYIAPRYTFAASPTAEIGSVDFFTIPSNRLSAATSTVHAMTIAAGDIAVNTALVLKTGGTVTGSGNGTLQIKIKYQILTQSAF